MNEGRTKIRAALRLIARRIPTLSRKAMIAYRSDDAIREARALRTLARTALETEGLLVDKDRESIILAVELAGHLGETKMLRVKLTVEEFDALQSRADAAGLDISAFVRAELGIR